MALGMAIACGDDDGGGDDVGSLDDTGVESGSTATATTNGSSAENTSVGSTDASTGESTTAASDGSDELGTDGTGGSACGAAPCEPTEICVNPCCGGAGPLCYAPDGDGACEAGDQSVDPSRCLLGGCDADLCCLPAGGCEAPPPFCVDSGELQCDDGAKYCNVGDCFGPLEGDQLACTCA